MQSHIAQKCGSHLLLGLLHEEADVVEHQVELLLRHVLLRPVQRHRAADREELQLPLRDLRTQDQLVQF